MNVNEYLQKISLEQKHRQNVVDNLDTDTGEHG